MSTNGGVFATLGEQVTRAPEFPRNSVSDVLEYQFAIPLHHGLNLLRTKALLTSSGLDGLIPRDVHPFVRPYGSINLFDVLRRTTTRSNKVHFVQQTMRTNAAAVVAEGAAKPESTFVYQAQEADVVTIATWIPATNRMLADSDVFEAIVDMTLVHGLEEELENQIVNGAGGSAMQGILNTPGINTYAKTASDTVASALQRAMTLVFTMGDAIADTIVLHPQDAERLALGVNTYGDLERRRLDIYGIQTVRIVQSIALPVGTGLVGAFDIGCMLFDRERGRVDRGYTNDGFVRNILVLRAELDAAFAVFRPAVFTQVTGLDEGSIPSSADSLMDAFVPTSPVAQSGDYTVSMAFFVDAPSTLVGFGMYRGSGPPSDLDGVAIGLYRNSDHALVWSGTMPSLSVGWNHWSITPITLSPSDSYYFAWLNPNGTIVYVDNTHAAGSVVVGHVHNGLAVGTWNGGYAAGSSLQYPSTTDTAWHGEDVIVTTP